MTIVILVALRFVIGFHFYSEGAAKIRDPKPFSAGFFGNAKGMFAPVFRGMVWDPDGLARLGYAEDGEGRPSIVVEPTLDRWDQFRAQAAQHYGFDDEQQKRAKQVNDRRDKQLRAYIEGYKPELTEYFMGVKRRDRNREDAMYSQVTSMWGQARKWEQELAKQRVPLVSAIDAIWSGYEADINGIATAEQRAARGWLSLERPGRRPLDSESFDAFIPYFDIAVGLLLMFGFLTRPAAIVGGLFLASVVASQFPGAPGAIPTWPYLIEMLGMFVLAATGAGRFAGADGLLRQLWKRMFTPKQAGSRS